MREGWARARCVETPGGTRPGIYSESFQRNGFQRRVPAEARGSRETWLFDFDVIAGVNLAHAVRDEHRRCIRRSAHHNSLADHLTRHIFPRVFRGDASVTVYVEGDPLGLKRRLVFGSLVAEDSE